MNPYVNVHIYVNVHNCHHVYVALAQEFLVFQGRADDAKTADLSSGQ